MLDFSRDLIVLSPHSDDAIIAVGGLLGNLGCNDRVVVMSCGDSSKVHRKSLVEEDVAFSVSKVPAYQRSNECLAAYSCYGIEPTINPFGRDYEDHLSDVGERVVMDWLYEHVKVRGTILLAPMDDGHQDHAFLNRIATVIGRNVRNECEVWFYALPYKLKVLPDVVVPVVASWYDKKQNALKQFTSQLDSKDIELIERWDKMMGGFVMAEHGEGVFCRR